MWFFTLLTLFKIMNDNIQLLKPNEMISVFAELDLNRTARHLFNYFLQHAQRKIKFENYQGDTFHINIKELNELANINPNTYEIVEKSLRCLMRPVEIRNDPHCYEAFVPVTCVKVNKKTGEYDFTLQRLVIDLLRQTDYFTKLDLQEFNPFKSKFSLVILEFLKQYEKLDKIPEVSVTELRKITDTQKKYPNFKHLQQYVLDVAVREINESTNYSVSYELIKVRTQRRPRVNAIQFFFKKKEKNIVILSAFSQDSLYFKFKRYISNLNEKDYIQATYMYTETTLSAFLLSLEKNNNKINNDKFKKWLSDRVNDERYYNYKLQVMKFSYDEICYYFNSAIDHAQTKISDENLSKINELLNYYNNVEYVVLVREFEKLFNEIFVNNSYNAFSKMIERNK